jgi:large subunit ribosomal protein L6
VEGPKGKQSVPIPAGITFKQTDGILELVRDGDDKAALHGLTRALTSNAVVGVSTGFTRELQIFGVGYKVDVKGRIATFTLGYSHPIEFYLPEGIDMKVEKPVNNLTPLILTGGDRQLLGQVCANMRALRPPDPYKNKGVRYANEPLRKKAGKTGAAGGAK